MRPNQAARPGYLVRLGLLLAFAAFAAIEHNPLVRLEAKLGLSPAPLERFFGIKNLFSGMTEGIHRLVLLDLRGSLEANVFAPLMFVIIVVATMAWKVPKVDSRKKELVFFAVFISLSILVNVFNR